MKEPEMDTLGKIMAHVLDNIMDEKAIADAREATAELAKRFPLYED